MAIPSVCSECEYFTLDGFKVEDNKGVCRYYAPGSGPTGSTQSVSVGEEQHARAVWPIVETDTVACGDGKRIPQP